MSDKELLINLKADKKVFSDEVLKYLKKLKLIALALNQT